jgi:hypothetical protein
LFVEAVPNIDETAYVNPDSFKPFDFIAKPFPLPNDDDNTGEKVPVLILRPLEDQECFEGESVSFIAEVKGTPRPQVNIFQNEKFNYLLRK